MDAGIAVRIIFDEGGPVSLDDENKRRIVGLTTKAGGDGQQTSKEVTVQGRYNRNGSVCYTLLMVCQKPTRDCVGPPGIRD